MNSSQQMGEVMLRSWVNSGNSSLAQGITREFNTTDLIMRDGVAFLANNVLSVNLECDGNLTPAYTVTLDLGDFVSLSFFFNYEEEMDEFLLTIIRKSSADALKVDYISGFDYYRLLSGSGVLTSGDW